MRKAEKDSVKVPVLRLTPELKEHALKHGMSLFANPKSKELAGLAAGASEFKGKVPQQIDDLWEDYPSAQLIKQASQGQLPRVGATDGGGQKITPERIVEVKQAAKMLQQAAATNIIDKPGTAGDHGVWRGLTLPPGTNINKVFPHNKIHNFDGLTAVARDKKFAENYLDPQFAGNEPGIVPVLLNIQRRGGVIGYDRKSDLAESILPAGAKYRVVRKVKRPDGVYEVELYDNGSLNNLMGKKSEDYVPREPTQEHDHDEPETQKRAAGGRVVSANVNPNPTEAQKKSGAYAKDHVNIAGFSISIENPKGSTRSGVAKDGTQWKATLPCHYGYFTGVKMGADGDHVDCYLGPHRKAPNAFIIDQVDPDTKKFDEHKVVLFAANQAQALNFYKRAFSDGLGKDRIGAVATLSLAQLKDWLRNGNTKKPLINHH